MSVPCLTRRAAISGAAALGALAAAHPAFAFRSHAIETVASPIAGLWSRAENLKMQMTPHAAAIEAATTEGGIQGWMRLTGAANALGEARYSVIVEILKSRPRSRVDLTIQSRAARDPEMVHGPRLWAKAQFDRAAAELGRAA